MDIGGIRSDREQLLVASNREAETAAVFRQDREVEGGGPLVGLEAERVAIVTLGRIEVPELVLEPPEVDVHRNGLGVPLQGFVVGVDRLVRRNLLESEGTAEGSVGIRLAVIDDGADAA